MAENDTQTTVESLLMESPHAWIVCGRCSLVFNSRAKKWVLRHDEDGSRRIDTFQEAIAVLRDDAIEWNALIAKERAEMGVHNDG